MGKTTFWILAVAIVALCAGAIVYMTTRNVEPKEKGLYAPIEMIDNTIDSQKEELFPPIRMIDEAINQ